jgi:predicted transcriptional regulator
MQANPKPRRLRGDEPNERAILALLVASHPVPLTIPELARELGDREAVTRAICGLADFGLLEFRGKPGRAESLRPTAAARRCHRLDAW